MRRQSLLAPMGALAIAFAPALIAPLAAQVSPAEVAETSEATPTEMRAAQVVQLLNGKMDEAPETLFTDGFLAAVPVEQIEAIARQITGQFGAAISVEAVTPRDGTRASLAIRLERAIVRGGIAIDAADGNRISELLFNAFDPIDDSPEKISEALSALPGTTNALLARLGPDGVVETVFAHNADTPLALGSTFKLYVLAALSEGVRTGRHRWDEVVPLTTRSLPSGQMQDWPLGAPVTLHTLATMMISISDNTATDQLIAALGRDKVEKEVLASGLADPERTFPWLTTRELFTMRGVSPEMSARYLAADDAGQLAILESLRDTDLSTDTIREMFASETPGALEIEWHASPHDLAGLLARIAGAPDDTARAIMSVDPQMSEGQAAQWDYAGYKGGSEPGVMNLTWLLRDEAGAYWIATAGWNNPDAKLEEAAFFALAQRLLALPR